MPTAVLPRSRALSSPTTAVIPSNVFNSAAVEVIAVPFILSASVSNVPSISASPLISKEPASNSPLRVKVRPPV